MAGAGVKLFIDGEILDAAEVNTYLQDQVIMRFANAATRDAAVGGVGEPLLAEGMFCYLNDTNVLQSYTGSAWVDVASSQTVANLSSGLVFIAQANLTTGSTVSIANCFSSTYDSYRVVVSFTRTTGAGTAYCFIEMGASVGANHFMSGQYMAWNNGTRNGDNGGAGYLFFTSANANAGSFDIHMPNRPSNTFINTIGNSADYQTTTSVKVADLTQYTGFTFFVGTGAFSSGQLTVYGYKKS